MCFNSNVFNKTFERGSRAQTQPDPAPITDEWTRIQSKAHLRRESAGLRVAVEVDIPRTNTFPPTVAVLKREAIFLVEWAGDNSCFLEGQKYDSMYFIRLVEDTAPDD